MVGLESLVDESEIAEIKQLISNHQSYTNSNKAKEVLADWENNVGKFVKVMPRDYKRVLEAIQQAVESGLTGDDALSAAFEANSQDVARIGGS